MSFINRYYFVNLDNHEAIEVPDLPQLTEHCYSLADTSKLLRFLYMKRWKKCRVVQAQIEPVFIVAEIATELQEEIQQCFMANKTISINRDSYNHVHGSFAINHDTKQVCSLQHQLPAWFFIKDGHIYANLVDTLQLLITADNGSSFGGYREDFINSNTVGAWVGHSIEVTDELPIELYQKGYMAFQPLFSAEPLSRGIGADCILSHISTLLKRHISVKVARSQISLSDVDALKFDESCEGTLRVLLGDFAKKHRTGKELLQALIFSA